MSIDACDDGITCFEKSAMNATEKKSLLSAINDFLVGKTFAMEEIFTLPRGISAIFYRINSGERQSYTGLLNLEEAGDYTIDMFAVDDSGNTGETLQTKEPILVRTECDNTLPSVSIGRRADAYCDKPNVGGDVTVDFRAEDDGMLKSAMNTERTSLLSLLKDTLIGESYAATSPEGITEIYYRVNSGVWLQYSLV